MDSKGLLKKTLYAIVCISVSWFIGYGMQRAYPLLYREFIEGLQWHSYEGVGILGVIIAVITAVVAAVGYFITHNYIGDMILFPIVVAVLSGAAATVQAVWNVVHGGEDWAMTLARLLIPMGLFAVVFGLTGSITRVKLYPGYPGRQCPTCQQYYKGSKCKACGGHYEEEPCLECDGAGYFQGDWQPDWMVSMSGCGGGGGDYEHIPCKACSGTGRNFKWIATR